MRKLVFALLLAVGCAHIPTTAPASPAALVPPLQPRHLGMSIPPTVYYDGTGAKIGSGFAVQFPSGFTGSVSAGKVSLAVASGAISNAQLANSTFVNANGDQGSAIALGGTLHRFDASGYATQSFSSGGGNVTVAAFTPNTWPGGTGWTSCSLIGEWNIKDSTDPTKNAYIRRSGSASKSTGSWVVTGQTLSNFNPASEPFNGLLATDGTIINFQIDTGTNNGVAEVYWTAICQN